MKPGKFGIIIYVASCCSVVFADFDVTDPRRDPPIQPSELVDEKFDRSEDEIIK